LLKLGAHCSAPEGEEADPIHPCDFLRWIVECHYDKNAE
jgi:hypothetical protein